MGRLDKLLAFEKKLNKVEEIQKETISPDQVILAYSEIEKENLYA